MFFYFQTPKKSNWLKNDTCRLIWPMKQNHFSRSSNCHNIIIFSRIQRELWGNNFNLLLHSAKIDTRMVLTLHSAKSIDGSNRQKYLTVILSQQLILQLSSRKSVGKKLLWCSKFQNFGIVTIVFPSAELTWVPTTPTPWLTLLLVLGKSCVKQNLC